jgi:hypothetical protein
VTLPYDDLMIGSLRTAISQLLSPIHYDCNSIRSVTAEYHPHTPPCHIAINYGMANMSYYSIWLSVVAAMAISEVGGAWF